MHNLKLVKCCDCIHCSSWSESQEYGECNKFQDIVHLTEPATCGFYKEEDKPNEHPTN